MTGNILTSKEGFKEETIDKVLFRYSGFGKELYHLLEKDNPLFFRKLRFYQDTTYQMKDSYAVYENRDKSFAIQLDPDIEVIIICNLKIHIEIGSWIDNPEEKAMKLIKEDFL